MFCRTKSAKKKKTSFLHANFRQLSNKKCLNLFGHPTLGSGGKNTFKWYLKSEHTDRQTDGQTDGHYRKHRPRGLMLWKPISDGPSANLRKLFNSNVIQVYVSKCSQNWTRTIRSSVFGTAKNVKITYFACIFQIFGYANNTTYDGPSAILRQLYNRYFSRITIEKWS